MRKNNIFLLTSAFVLLFSGCLKEEELEGSKPVTLEPMTFHASMESGADTKTVIEGNVGDDVRYLKWLPEDRIGVYNTQTRKFETFVNVNEETSATAVFEGVNSVQDVYYAVYPYSELHSYAEGDKIMTVDLPAVQNYAENTFGNGANPMVAHAESGEELMFQNLCGVLVINLTGDVSVKSIDVTLFDDSGSPAAVSGEHTVSMNYVESPTLTSTWRSTDLITLYCADGVDLNTSEPTPFHVIVPSGTYSGISIRVITTDGQMMIKQGTNPLRIRRSRVTSAGVLEYQEEVSINLSERGTSNCYLVSEPGVYSFDATVIGNGEFGIVPDAGFHANDINIAPATVELLWEDVPGLVQSVYCVNGRAGFYYSGKEGNSVLAAKDASGTILWSWHIWATDEPDELVYKNAAGDEVIMLDRNIGATGIDSSEEEWENTIGAYYQWGRKDPMVRFNFTTEGLRTDISESIEKPNVMLVNNYGFGSSWNYDWMIPTNEKLWHPDTKTIYDPCPIGYRIPGVENIEALTEYHSVLDNGVYVLFDDHNSTWFPKTGFYYGEHDYKANDDVSYIWTSNYSEALGVSSTSNSISFVDHYRSVVAVPVRCMKDEGHVDISYPQVEFIRIENLTSKSARAICRIKSDGVSEVTERGVIYGIENDLSDGVKAVSNDKSEEFSVELNLSQGTRYYIKPYAINGRGESRSTEIAYFITLSTDSEVFLSQGGTANCYIASPVPSGVYSFDCTVQGNSEDTVGTVESLEVLWEVDGCSATATHGTVISSVELKNGVLGIIKLPSVVKEGNALIAAKDNDGTILWSWHIWITDTPVEQTYLNDSGTFVVLDRNIGATRADRGEGDEWLDSRGLAYFWGRKDPFWYESYSFASSFLTLEQSIENPTMTYYSNRWTWGNTSWLGNGKYIPTLWMEDEKTKYDPCPLGYRVSVSRIWDGFTSTGKSTAELSEFNVKGRYDYGWEFYVDTSKSTTAWYPVGYVGRGGSNLSVSNESGHVWSSDYIDSSTKYDISYSNQQIYFRENTSVYASQDGNAFAVRCMKE